MIYERLGSVLPSGMLGAFARELRYNGVKLDPRVVTGFIFIYDFFLSLGISWNAYLFLGITPLIGFPTCFAGIAALAYVVLRLRSEAKGKFVESILPDALQLIASNMKSGLTTERALFVAGRPEFGQLQVELRNASKRISSGESVDSALARMGDGINSQVLSNTLWLISRGIKSGGQIADLLFQLADDLKEQQAIEEEAKANISLYILLIFFAAIFGAPLLFGVSSFIVQVLSKQMASTPTLSAAGIPNVGSLGIVKSFATGERHTISTDFIMFFSLVTLTITTVFSSLTIGVMNTGKEINGIKYIVPILVLSFIVFFVARALLLQFFGSLAT